ncbi:UvrD-helicase domain-containing protein [Curtobacterium sp. RHCJP20]|uniref:UvrD-helicase domain-containing protein n=1 Tax=Curtobacterium subtropicum TaxID=3055138 RepID=A0ABT7TD38_9MICO|nr:UvrD-helicase domain-containing protein [Curtobacterium subtropicum]MDM7887487.1 UvrD-helicase domain-containing protein [Curtobacterium subtropicum]
MDKALQASAESESQSAFAQIVDALQQKKSFKLEAGAGAGKTFSLVQALDRILGDRQAFLPLPYQRVACLTYTNVARDEIRARVGVDSAILVDTLHGFLWEMIAPFQKPMLERLRSLGRVQFDEVDAGDIVAVEYTLGIPSVRDKVASLHHEDVPSLAAELFREQKFVKVIADRFPVVFVDEYQDTPAGFLEAALVGFDGLDRPPIVGLFGDAWQQIYDDTCGSIERQGLSAIPKKANFRSDRAVVDLLNKLRPSLPQAPSDKAMDGSVTIFHTNHWVGERQKGQWKGQISEEATSESLAQVREWLVENGMIDGLDDVKILMLTHSSIGNELGYPSLSRVFRYNDSFIKKQDPTIEFFSDSLEPALEAYEQRRFGLMFSRLGGRMPLLRSAGDKLRWAAGLSSLTAVCGTGTVGDVLDAIQDVKLFSLPSRVASREADSRRAADVADPRRLVEHRKLRDVSYSEIRALRSYLAEQSVFSTKHSVKGAEFDNVLVVVGRGWSKYDFGKMLAADPDAHMNEKERASYERARNLFYVACSRAKKNLVLLFVQELDAPAEARLHEFVGQNNIHEVKFS